MHIMFPQKIENSLRFLRLKLLPKTLFFRTMLLIFIPLILVQVVSIIAFFDGNWSKVGRRLSDNLSNNMAFVVRLAEQNPQSFEQIQTLAQNVYALDVEYFDNSEKIDVLSKASRRN